jgi:hypothetical protein
MGGTAGAAGVVLTVFGVPLHAPTRMLTPIAAARGGSVLRMNLYDSVSSPKPPNDRDDRYRVGYLLLE